MQKFLFILSMLFLLSCGKDSAKTEQNLLGTWMLSSIEGTCLGIPTNSSSNEIGCIDIPALEVNCSIIEINAGGTLTYAYNLVEGNGSYTIDGNEISICTDRCLTYSLDGNILTLQTGTVELCDPLYTFTKVSTTLDELISTKQRKFISALHKNGKIHNTYNYNPDGSIQTIQRFLDNGNLYYTEVYTFTPLTTSRLRTYASSGNIQRYEYYNEAPNRTRRDLYGSNGQLEQYNLYFHDDNDCWVERTEEYINGTLYDQTNYTYSGENCNIEWKNYRQGELRTTFISQKDGKKYWGEAFLLNILQYKKISNTTSATYIKNGEVDTNSSYTSIFTYGEDDYPTTELRTLANGNIDLYTFTYE